MYTIKAMAQEIGVGESTVRFWRDRHKDFIPHTGKGRKRRYPEEALETLRFIAECSAEGKSAAEVEEALNRKCRVIEIPSQNAAVYTAEQQPQPEAPPEGSTFLVSAMKKTISQGLAMLLEKLSPLGRLEGIERELRRSNEIQERIISQQDRKMDLLEKHVAELSAKMNRLQASGSTPATTTEATANPFPPEKTHVELADAGTTIEPVSEPSAADAIPLEIRPEATDAPKTAGTGIESTFQASAAQAEPHSLEEIRHETTDTPKAAGRNNGSVSSPPVEQAKADDPEEIIHPSPAKPRTPKYTEQERAEALETLRAASATGIYPTPAPPVRPAGTERKRPERMEPSKTANIANDAGQPARNRKAANFKKRAEYTKRLTERIVFLKEVRGKHNQAITDLFVAKNVPNPTGRPWHPQAVATLYQLSVKRKKVS